MYFHKGFLLEEGLIALAITIVLSSITLTLVSFCDMGEQSIKQGMIEINENYEEALWKEICLDACIAEPTADSS